MMRLMTANLLKLCRDDSAVLTYRIYKKAYLTPGNSATDVCFAISTLFDAP